MNHPHNMLFYDYVYSRIEKNQNFLGIAVGGTGSGKSYTMMRIAQKLDPSFTADRVCFTPKEFMEKIQEELPSGSVIMYDEAGVGVDARSWQSISNKMINYVLQTFRYRNLIVLFTVPKFDFIDKNCRALFHVLFKTQSIRKASKLAVVKPYIIAPDHTASWRGSQGYIKKFMKTTLGGRYVKIDTIYLRLPRLSLRRDYEDKKHEFCKNLYDKLGLELEDKKKVKKVELTDRQKEVYALKKEGVEPVKISKELGISQSSVHSHLKRIEKKLLVTTA